MNADKNPVRPKTLTMMGGPIDTRKAPTAVNTLATQRPHAWFQQNVIATVPMIYPGAGRKVYPGFLQLAGFMTMNLGSHLISHWEMFKHLVDGDEESADATARFLRRISLGLRHDRRILPADGRRRVPAPSAAQGRARCTAASWSIRRRSRTPRCSRSRASATIFPGIGQTKAALDLATKLPAAKKQYLLAKDVGHYGIFNGRKWREKIAPVVEKFIAANA